MSKSAERRFETEKRIKKWEQLLKSMSMNERPNSLSFGRVFSQDPIDCGNPRCQICSPEKVLKKKGRRILFRREERLARLDLGHEAGVAE